MKDLTPIEWLITQFSVTFKEVYAEEFKLAKRMENKIINELKERIDGLENQILEMGQTSESDLFDFVKRAYFLIPKGKANFKYYDTKAYYNEEGWYMYDADNIRQFLPKEWLILGKID